MSGAVYDPYALPKWCLISAAAAALGVWAFARGAGLARTPLDPPLWGWLACLSVGTALSPDKSVSFLGLSTHVNGWVAFVQCLILLSAAAGLELASVRRLCACAAAGAALAGLYGIGQYFGIELHGGVRSLQYERVIGSAGSPVFLGAYVAACLPLALYFALSGKGAGRALGAAAAGVLVAAAVLTVSRGAWISAAVGAGFFFWLAYLERSPLWRAAIWSALSTLTLVLMLWLTLRVGLKGRLTSFFGLADPSNAGRVRIWLGALRVFAEHPWFGCGPDLFRDHFRRFRTVSLVRALGPTLPYQAHSEFLQILSTLGALGAAFYLSFLWVLGRMAQRVLSSASDRPLCAALAASLAALYIQKSVNATDIGLMGLGALLAGALAALRSRSEKSSDWGLRPPAKTAAAAAVALLGLSGTVLVGRVALASRERLLAAADRRYPPLAVDHFREAVRLNPSNAAYVTDFAYYLETVCAGDPSTCREGLQEAVSVTEAAVRRHPLDAELRNQHGAALLWLSAAGVADFREQARQELEEGLKMDPADPFLWSNRAKLARIEEDPSERRYWAKVLELSPADPVALAALASPPR